MLLDWNLMDFRIGVGHNRRTGQPLQHRCGDGVRRVSAHLRLKTTRAALALEQLFILAQACSIGLNSGVVSGHGTSRVSRMSAGSRNTGRSFGRPNVTH